MLHQDMKDAIDRVRAEHLRQQEEDPAYWERDAKAKQDAIEVVSRGPMHYISGAAKALQAAVTPDSPMAQARLNICKGCDQWDGTTCRQCGCFTALKVRLPKEACPMGKWAAEG